MKLINGIKISHIIMHNYKKGLVSVASKTFALFVIVSILLPLPVVNIVYAQIADAVVSSEATAVSTANATPESTVQANPDSVTTVSADTTEKAAEVTPISGGGSGSANVPGGNPSCFSQVDVNHDGVLDNNDFTTFQTLYAAQNPVADFNHDGQFNAQDFQDFLNAFNACGGNGTGSIPECVRADMNLDGQLTPADFPAFEAAYSNQNALADFDQNGFFNANDFQAFLNAYANCGHSTGSTQICARVDINNDGVLNADDYAAFQTAYDNNQPIADFDQNGSFNANDFQAFVNAFAQCGGNNSNPACARADINHDGVLTPADFTAFETIYNGHDMAADFDLNNTLNANDFQSFMNAYAVCPHQNTGGGSHNGSITVSPISGTTKETGDSVTISVALGSVPTSPVTIDISSSKTSEGVLSTDSLTLDASHMVQSFVVTGVDDHVADGDQSYSVVFAPTTSSDSNYNNVHVNDVPLVNIDNGDHPTNGGGGNGGGGSGGTGGFSSFGGGTGYVGGIGNGEVLGASTINPLCNYLGSYLKRGDNNDMVEVMKLQSFLKTSEGFTNLEVNGIFDDATFNAVSAFQKKYGAEVLAPWGYSVDHATGYVYILTKNKINELFCRNEIALTPAQQDEINSFKASRALAMTDEVSKKKLITN